MSLKQTAPSVTGTIADWSATGCPICGSKTVSDFFHVPSIPIDAGACFPSEIEAQNAPRGQICLAVCHDCGYIGNRAFEYSRISFGTSYDISLDRSRVYQAFEDKTVARLVETHGIRNKTILEIGCGPGQFLQHICRAGASKGIGIDPSVPRVGTELCGTQDITFIRDLYSEKYAQFKADLICCRQMFCLISNPLEFLKMVRRNIGTHEKTALYFEVPNAEYQYDGPIQWNVFFEHASVFHSTSLRRTFARAGFLVRDCHPCYADDQYLYVDAVPGPAHMEASTREDVVSDKFLEKVFSFSLRYSEAEATWRTNIEKLKRSGKKVVGWGAGGRGVFFMNRFDIKELVPFVVDINPNRQNNYLPGTGQKIVSPEFLLSYKPDVILVTHSTYVKEITNQVREMGLQSEILPI